MIMVYKGTVVHGQNDANVVEYHLWTQQWTDMLQASKFSQEKWPLAFELLNNCGGENHEGYIGFQDHGDDVWFRNIRVKTTAAGRIMKATSDSRITETMYGSATSV